MIYITIILVAIIIASCILGLKYLTLKYNPALYETYESSYIAEEIDNILDRYTVYLNVKEEDKYKYHVSDREFIDVLHRILMYLNYNRKQDE